MDSRSGKVNSIFLFFKVARTRKVGAFAGDTLSFFEVKQLKLLFKTSGNSGTKPPHNCVYPFLRQATHVKLK